jgi:hypothetical protein
MINRIIEFSANNRFIVILVCAAAVFGWQSMRHVALDAIPDLSDIQVIVYSRWDRSQKYHAGGARADRLLHRPAVELEESGLFRFRLRTDRRGLQYQAASQTRTRRPLSCRHTRKNKAHQGNLSLIMRVKGGFPCS